MNNNYLNFIELYHIMRGYPKYAVIQLVLFFSNKTKTTFASKDTSVN
jgi:hypothetical protein